MKKFNPLKKIHFIKIIALCICMILLVTGCQGVTESIPTSSRWVSSEGPTITSLMPSTQTWPYVSSQPGTEESSAPASSSLTTSQLEQIERIRMVILQAGDFGQNICAFDNGVPLASGLFPDQAVWIKDRVGTNVYLYNIQYPYTVFPAFPSASFHYSVYSDTFQDEYATAGYEWGFGGWIAFTDDDYPFNFPITHHAYTADAQPARPDWKEAFIPLIEEKTGYDGGYDISDTPLIITDVWRFDLDGDGIDEELVRACNEVQIPKTDQEVKPASKNTGIYNIMILFSTTLETTVIYKESYFINKFVNEEFYAFEYENIENRGSGTTDTCVLQYDSEGNLILCPYYKYGEYWIIRPQIPIVCDADGDGKPELIVVKRSNEYWRVAVYKAGLESGELLWFENVMHP